MAIALTKPDCCGCSACASVCPENCITMLPDQEGFLYPTINESQCVECGLCETVCPVLHPTVPEGEIKPKAYAAVNPDAKIRGESSSGGVFTALAREILSRKGVVFGAAWSEDCREVRHIAVEEEEKLIALRGSKYLQSSVGDSYTRVRELLEAGRTVLFTGTPCQVEGLRTFLGKNYDNLLLADVICHGVPSQAVWQKYLAAREQKAGAKARTVNFRDKQAGWKRYGLQIEFENGTARFVTHTKDPYMQAFIENACLRPSCHSCRFKKVSRVSDLTMADFWGIGEVCPDMDDNRGTSLVLVHTEKGEQLLQMLNLQIQPVSLESALEGNSAALHAAPENPNRDVFLRSLEELPFEEAVKKWAKKPVTLKNRIGSFLEMLGLDKTIKKLLGMK